MAPRSPGLVPSRIVDADVVVALAFVVFLDLPAAFFDRVGIERRAAFEIGFLGQPLILDLGVAQVLHIKQRRPLDDLDGDPHAAGDLLANWPHVEEPLLLRQCPHVFFERRLIERAVDARADGIQDLGRRPGFVAHNPNLDHVLLDKRIDRRVDQLLLGRRPAHTNQCPDRTDPICCSAGVLPSRGPVVSDGPVEGRRLTGGGPRIPCASARTASPSARQSARLEARKREVRRRGRRP